ncbi:MAG: T9SS type B sorting domain-containing protein [Bacteroidota bacterium]
MRKKYFLLFLFSVFIQNIYGQGSPACATAQPFCASSSSNSLTFPNTTGSSSPGGGVDYGCLDTQPNPAWFYMQIKQAGNLNFVISQTADASAGGGPIDVDFIAWGPFTSPSCGPANLNSSTKVDCSYSTSANETFTIHNALVGEYYMVLITNFRNLSGTIKLSQASSSTGSTNCDIVCPLSIVGGDVPICKDPILTAVYVNSIAPTFKWTKNGVPIPGANLISYIPTSPGTYCVIANSPGCGINQTVCVEVPDNPVITIGAPRNPLLGCNFAAFNLTTNTALILGGLNPANYVVNYHKTLAEAQNNILPIGGPELYFGVNGETVYVSIHDLINPKCITTTQFKLKTLPCGPIPIKPIDLQLCDDLSNNGIETFDLTQQYETIIGANNPTKYTTTFHTSLADADNDVNPIVLVSGYQNIISNSQTIYVRLEENVNQSNYGLTDFKLIVNPIAIFSIIGSTICAPIKAEPNIPGTYSYQWTVPVDVPDPGNVAVFTTTLPGVYSVIATNTVTGCVSEMASGIVSDSTFPTVTVTSSIICAESLTTVTAVPGIPGNYTYDWIVVPSGFPNPGNVASFTTGIPGTYKVKITNSVSSCVSANGIGTVALIPLPTVTVNSESICQGGTAILTATPGVISDNYIYYWTSPSGVIVGNTQSFSTTVGGVYSVIIKDLSTGCSSHSASGTVEVKLLPAVDPNVVSPVICSGQTTNIELPSSLPNTNFTWSTSSVGVSGALDGTGDHIAQTLTATGYVTGTVIYTITPRSDGCEGRTSTATIYVTPIPVVTATPMLQTICSETKSYIELTSPVAGTIFNWTVIQNRVRGAIGGTGNIIQQQLTSTSTIPGEAIYTIYPIYGDCQGDPITVVVTVSPNPEVFGFSETTICNGTSTNISLSPNLPATTLEWTVVQTNVTGAMNGNGNVIDQILTLTGNVEGTVVYTVTPTSNDCVGKPIEITVRVKPLPTLDITGGLICVDEITDIASQTFTIETGLSESIYVFRWYFNNVLIENANNSYYEATQSGVYGVIATDIASGCESQIYYATITDAFVGQTVTAVVAEAFSESPTVIVNVQGGNVEFVYQLDNGIPQSSNVFSPVALGLHTVTVTDVNQCTSLTTEVMVLGYPHYFTPNGDGINDTWNIIGFEDRPETKIFIYDRYGKLMTQISSTDKGWDGTYNGNLMPSSDYWFTVDYIENGINKVFKSHFALKVTK